MQTVTDDLSGFKNSKLSSALATGFDESLDTVIDDIATTGLACVRGVVTEEWLHDARAFVQSTVELHGKQEVFIEDIATDPSNFANRILADARLEPFLASVAHAGLDRLERDGQEIENELRVVSGPPITDDPLWFHYDGTAITMVLPILMPTSVPGQSGELILCPNRRPFRRSVIANIIEKSLSQNDAYRRHFVKKKLRASSNVMTVPLEPGNAYLFCGYRSYHATLPCPPDTVRVTLLLHFGAVHHDSRLLSMARAQYQKALRRRRAGGPVGSIRYAALS